MLHRTFSRKGGQVRSTRKTEANRAKAAAYWTAVRAGDAAPPRHHRKPPEIDIIRRKLAPYCRRKGIIQLDIFGSSARGEAGRRSDVDLMASFQNNPGLGFFAMEEEMSAILGVPVHLLTRESVETMSNPYRRSSILADARVIYHAQARP
jgi:predicted nucleotidyltransferase